MLLDINSFSAGSWIAPDDGARVVNDAATGREFARAGGADLDAGQMLSYAKSRGGPALRKMGFQARAGMVKALALHLNDHKDELYQLSFHTGATQRDHPLDIDAGIATMLVLAGKAQDGLPAGRLLPDGPQEALSPDGSFVGQHIQSPLTGVALHINAFNFPVWGMLAKLAPSLLAGMPAIIKPATPSAYVAERAFRLMQGTGILPEGAVQFLTRSPGKLLDLLDGQDVVAFTGSAHTAELIRTKSSLHRNAARFLTEQDSLNASILGADAIPGTPEFNLFLQEVVREITVKAGQKCTAIRRILVPIEHLEEIGSAISEALRKVVIGNPRDAFVDMGTLISGDQRNDVMDQIDVLMGETERLCGRPDEQELVGLDWARGAYLRPTLLLCRDPDAARRVHDTEVFGPVATLMGYRDLDHAVRLANRAGGALVTSVITHDTDIARQITLEAAALNGRIYINDRSSMGQSTGHGAALPHLVHGGPGRAGGCEELGGLRALSPYMQRTALQGSPAMLEAVLRSD